MSNLKRNFTEEEMKESKRPRLSQELDNDQLRAFMETEFEDFQRRKGKKIS